MTIEIKLKFNGRDLAERRDAVITSGSVDTVTAAFEFDAAWDGFTKTAIFASGDTIKRVLLDDTGVCTVPWEVLTDAKQLTVGVVGMDGDRVLPSVRVPVALVDGIYTNGTAPADPTPDVYEQLIALAKETEQVAQSVRDDADSGKFDGKKGDKGAKGEQGLPGKDGTSVTVVSVAESEADGGSNVVTFSDGSTLTVKNGNKGSTGAKGDKGDTGANGYTPVRGVDYWTSADQAEINAAVENANSGAAYANTTAENAANAAYLANDAADNALDAANAASSAAQAANNAAANANVAAAQITKQYELIEEITLTEDTAQITRTQYPDGTAMALNGLLISVECEAGETTGSIFFAARAGTQGNTYSITNAIHTAKRYSAFLMENSHGVYTVTLHPASAYGLSSNKQVTTGFVITSDSINYFDIHGSASQPIPAGSVIKIYGVKA